MLGAQLPIAITPSNYININRYVFSFTVCKYCMYCHLLINDELLLEKSNQESGPFLIPLVVVPIETNPQRIRNGTSGSFSQPKPILISRRQQFYWNYH